jgi:hypothetical protein
MNINHFASGLLFAVLGVSGAHADTRAQPSTTIVTPPPQEAPYTPPALPVLVLPKRLAPIQRAPIEAPYTPPALPVLQRKK